MAAREIYVMLSAAKHLAGWLQLYGEILHFVQDDTTLLRGLRAFAVQEALNPARQYAPPQR